MIYEGYKDKQGSVQVVHHVQKGGWEVYKGGLVVSRTIIANETWTHLEERERQRAGLTWHNVHYQLLASLLVFCMYSHDVMHGERNYTCPGLLLVLGML